MTDYINEFKQKWLDGSHYPDIRKCLDFLDQSKSRPKPSRHPYDVMYNILNIIPKSVRDDPEVTRQIEYTMNDWMFTAPEIYNRAWNRMFNVLQEVTNVNFTQFEANPEWVQTVWHIYTGEIEIEN